MFSTRLKGQSTLEYVILIGFVVSALIAMGIYMKRGIQGKLRESTDQVGEQYSANHTSGVYTTRTSTKQYDKMLANGATSTEWKVADENENFQQKWGHEYIANLDAKD